MSATAQAVRARAPRVEVTRVWEPSEKQREFLASPENEVLYGGAAGGGKSDALLVDVLGLHQNALEYRSYQGVLFRRSFRELEQLIDRSKQLYPQCFGGAIYNKTEKVWQFPSGAQIKLRYMARPEDRYAYQGHEYQYIGWDELTQQPSDVGYVYMMSRLRTTETQLSCFVRGTTNPGGFGHSWVKRRWGIPDEGTAVQFTVKLEDGEEYTDDAHEAMQTRIWHRRFIPARLGDNPHLSESGYRQQLMMLSPMERRALLAGRWDVIQVEGAIYAEELEAAQLEGRICNIPFERSVPVDTYWDLGRRDATAVWYAQHVGMENRFIGYQEASLKSITYWGRQQRKWIEDRGGFYGTHHMPHDVTVVSLGLDNRSRKKLFESQGVQPIVIVPRTPLIEDGIAVTREALATAYFDRAGCAQGLEALGNYRYEWDEQQQVHKSKPLHSWASNGADAFRQYAQIHKPGMAGTRKSAPIDYGDDGTSISII